jgi:predicted glycoside hydrolase/deacetylase ChbG (UPF0249 family)
VLILHANEMGLCYESNAAVSQLLDTGAIRSASAMAPCPWFPDAAQWSNRHPDADIGLELTINSELEDYRYRSVASDRHVSTLLDPDRFFWPSTIQTMVNASAEEVERELVAQLAYARSLGLKPTHLTTHLGALFTRPDLIEVYLRMARQQWIPAIVVEETPAHLKRFRSHGFPLPDELIQLFNDYPLPKLDDLRILPPADDYEAKKQALVTMIREMPPGLTQIALHPAIESEALKRIAPDWQRRVWAERLLADADIADLLRDEKAILTDWREIMSRFEGRPASAAQSVPGSEASK